MSRQLRTSAVAALALGALASTAWGAGKPHQHGVASAQLSVDGPQLSLSVQLPQHDVLGFERPPRTEAERRAADAVVQRLSDPTTLVRTAAAAGCEAGPVEVQAPMLAPGARAAADGHAEIEATVALRCRDVAALRQVELGLFAAFGKLSRVDVQVAGPRGQAKVVLRRPQAAVTLPR